MPRASPPPQPVTRQRIAALRRQLLCWYEKAQRDLPWRRSRDPYAIWVSEIMLQQTRVDVVVPYYERFLARFPDVPQLAAAPLDEVLQSWAGLGYYSRARNLHRAAQQIVATHAGVFPQRADELLALPGIGRYTAGAIGSMAFAQRVPLVDGNVMRVLSRFFALRDCIDSTQARSRFWEWASWWADCEQPGDANQALMELGATVCQPAAPDCSRCCAATLCRACLQNVQAEIPVRRRPRESEKVTLVAILLRQRGRLLLVRRRQGRLLRDFWEMPTVRLPLKETTQPHIDLGELGKPLRRSLGIAVASWKARGEARHSILHHRIHLQVLEGIGPRSSVRHNAAAANRPPRRPPTSEPDRNRDSALENLGEAVEARWTTAHECHERALTTLTRKALRAAARNDSSWEQYASHRPSQKATRQRRDEPTGDHP